MSRKIVYNSLVLACYITREDLIYALREGEINMPVFIGKGGEYVGYGTLSLFAEGLEAVRASFEAECEALESGRIKWQGGKLEATASQPSLL